MGQPALPYVDSGACPFEKCLYGRWSARETITVYDTWKPERREIAKLSVGEKVTGITGVLITDTPGIVRMDRDLGDLKRGDRILTYANRGEGYSAVWFKGQFHHDFDLTFAKLPDGTGCGGEHCAATVLDAGKKRWWAQVKLQSGATGWVDMDHGLLGGFDLP